MDLFATIIVCGALALSDCTDRTALAAVPVPGVVHSHEECFVKAQAAIADPAFPPGNYKIMCGPEYIRLGARQREA